MMLSTKDLVFKKRPVKKLIERYMGLYMVKEIVSNNAVILKLLTFMRIHSLVNVNRIVKHRELVKEKKVEKPKPIEVDRVEK